MARKDPAATKQAKGLAPTPLPDDLALDLEAFCAAHYKSEKGEVVRRALRFFIDARLADEPAMKVRFDAEKGLLLRSTLAVVPLRRPESIKPDSKLSDGTGAK
jgi:hypothetical protein